MVLNWFKRSFVKVGVLPFLLAALILIFSLAESRFMTLSNMVTVSRQATYLSVVTAAQMLTILCAGFDLSAGSSVALTSIVSSLIMVSIPSPAGAIVAGMAAGILTATLIGLTNGVTIAIFRVSPFIVTLGMMSVVHGLAPCFPAGYRSSACRTISTGFWGSAKSSAFRCPCWWRAWSWR